MHRLVGILTAVRPGILYAICLLSKKVSFAAKPERNNEPRR